MKWENFNLHIENFFPGVVSSILILSFLPDGILNSFLSNQYIVYLFKKDTFISSVFFVSSSYLLGIFVLIISRIFIDILSEWTFRPFLLRILDHPENNNITCWNFKKINEEYRKKISIVINSTNETIKNEVIKRRERGRLIRTTLIPAILMVFAFDVGETLCCKIICSVAVFLVITFFYAYSEVCVYKECGLHSG